MLWTGDGFHVTAHIQRAQVKEIQPFVNKNDNLIPRVWLIIFILWDAGQAATCTPLEHNWLRLWPPFTGKGHTNAWNPFEQIPRILRIDIPGNPFHDPSFLQTYPKNQEEVAV